MRSEVQYSQNKVVNLYYEQNRLSTLTPTYLFVLVRGEYRRDSLWHTHGMTNRILRRIVVSFALLLLRAERSVRDDRRANRRGRFM